MTNKELRIKTEEAIRLIHLYDFESAEKIIDELKAEGSKDATLASSLISIMLSDMIKGDDILYLISYKKENRIELEKEELESLAPWLKVLYMHLVLENNTENPEIIEASKGDEENTAYLLALYRATENSLFLEDDFEDYADKFLDAVKERYGENDWRYALALDYRAYIAYDLEIEEEKGLEYIEKAYKTVKETYGETSPYLIQILDRKSNILGALEKDDERIEALKEAFSIASHLEETNAKYKDILNSLAYYDTENSYKNQFVSMLNANIEKYGELSKEAIDAYRDLASDGTDDDKEKEKYYKKSYEIAKETYKDKESLYLEVYNALKPLLIFYSDKEEDDEKENNELVDFFSFLIPIYKDDAFSYFNKAVEESMDIFRSYRLESLNLRFLEKSEKDSPLYLQILLKVIEGGETGVDLFKLSKEALTLSERLKGKESFEYYKAKLLAGESYYNVGNKLRATRYQKEGIRGMIEIGAPIEEYGGYVTSLAYDLMREDNHKDAFDILDKYCKKLLSEEILDKKEIARVSFDLAYNAKLIKDFESFLNYSLISYKMYLECNGEYAKNTVTSLNLISNAYIDLRNYEEAKEYALKAYASSRKVDKTLRDDTEAIALYNLTTAYFWLKDLKNASETAIKAIRCLENLDDKNYDEPIQIIYQYAASSFYDLGNMKKVAELEREYKKKYFEELQY